MALFSRGIKLCKRRFSQSYFLPNLTSFGTETGIAPRKKEHPNFKISETHPGRHTLGDVGKFYKLPDEVNKQFSSAQIWPKEFKKQCINFQETCLMVREPGLEIIEYIKQSDYSRPINKYVLYGRKGTGKTMILSYVLHYALLEGWLIVSVPWVPMWLKSFNEVNPSEKQEGFYNIDLLATTWLRCFKVLNMNVLRNNKILIKKDYEWNMRESSKAGDTLLSIVEYGIMRGSVSSDVLFILLDEIKVACRNNEIKCMVLIDGFNALFHSVTQLKNVEKKFIPAEKITSLVGFRDMISHDWHNGAAVLTCDEIAVNDYSGCFLPLHLLTLKGFEHVHPFIPIEVKNFNDLEFKNVLNYYRERNWLQTTSADNEMKCLSGGNGYELMDMCKSLY